MLLSILEKLECPTCGNISSNWTINGDLHDDRITDGEIICPNNHTWIVKGEILRFDVESNDSPMEFLDHPRTGFPQEVDEQERFAFLDELQMLVEEISFEENEYIKIGGEPILFMKYLRETNGKFIVTYPDEGTLRQLQEIAVRKRMYNQMSFVKAEDIDHLGKMKQVSIFNSDPRSGINILLTENELGEVKWSGAKVNLTYLVE